MNCAVNMDTKNDANHSVKLPCLKYDDISYCNCLCSNEMKHLLNFVLLVPSQNYNLEGFFFFFFFFYYQTSPMHETTPMQYTLSYTYYLSCTNV